MEDRPEVFVSHQEGASMSGMPAFDDHLRDHFARSVAAAQEASEHLAAELDRRLRAATERYRVDPSFHARVYLIAQVFEARKAPELDIPEIPGEARYEIMLGMALQSIVASELFDEMHPDVGRLCGQQNTMVEGGAPCIVRGAHTTHTTASGRSWRSR